MTTYEDQARLFYVVRSLAGRCVNGAERDHGFRFHAVAIQEEPNGDFIDPALCGAKPGLRSVGWSEYGDGRPVSCPRCLAKLERISRMTFLQVLTSEDLKRRRAERQAAEDLKPCDGCGEPGRKIPWDDGVVRGHFCAACREVLEYNRRERLDVYSDHDANARPWENKEAAPLGGIVRRILEADARQTQTQGEGR